MTYYIQSSDKSKTYTCLEDKGKWSCTCPHYLFRLRGKGCCKHIDEAKTVATIDPEMAWRSIDWESPCQGYLIP